MPTTLMPLTKRTILDDPAFAPTRRHLEVRWSSLVHARYDVFGACENVRETTGEGHRNVELVISVQLLADDHAILEAWLALPRGPRAILAPQPVTCRTSHVNAMLHVDCEHEGRRLLALSLDDDGAIAYAQTDLLMESGFHGGAYDPPTVHPIDAQQDAASA